MRGSGAAAGGRNTTRGGGCPARFSPFGVGGVSRGVSRRVGAFRGGGWAGGRRGVSTFVVPAAPFVCSCRVGCRVPCMGRRFFRVVAYAAGEGLFPFLELSRGRIIVCTNTASV